MLEEDKIFSFKGDLTSILNKQRFREITDAYDKIRGKRKFQRGKNVIFMDQHDFTFFEGIHVCSDFESSEIRSQDLRFLFWYLNSNRADKDIISEDYFDLSTAKNTFDNLKFELGLCAEFGIKNSKVSKWQRLIYKYESTSLV